MRGRVASSDGAWIGSTMPLRVGETISLEIRGVDGTAHTVSAAVIRVEADELLNDRAELQFVDVADVTREWLAELVCTLPADGEAGFESDDDQVTNRRSVSDLTAALGDFDPPTLRKKDT